MFNLSVSSDEAVYSALVAISISFIVFRMIRLSRRPKDSPQPAIYVGIYNVILLLLFFLGMMTQIKLEGWGFVPLIVLTLPFSLCMGFFAPLMDHVLGTGANFRFPGSSFEATLLIHFVFFNVLCGAVNSCILYALLKRRWRRQGQEKATIPS